MDTRILVCWLGKARLVSIGALSMFLVAGSIAGCASSTPAGTYYWMNPKGQPVLIDRATNAPVRK